MESLMNDLRRTGDNITTASSLRLASRPQQLHEIFEHHGQSLLPRSPRKSMTRQASGMQKFKPAATGDKSRVGPAAPSTRCTSTRVTRKTQDEADLDLSDSQSEDELDLLSSPRNTTNDHSTSRKHMSNTQADGGFCDKDGKYHSYLKGFEPKTVLFTLKFNKKKDDKKKTSETSLSRPISPFPPTWQPSKDGSTLGSTSKSSSPIGDCIRVRHRPLSSKDSNSKLSIKSAPRDKYLSDPRCVLEGIKIGPPSRSARPRIKQTNRLEGGKRQASPIKRQTSPFPLTRDAAFLDLEGQKGPKVLPGSLGLSRSRSRSQCSSPRATVRKPEAFPTLSPPGSPALLPKHELLSHEKRQPKPFPMLSPTSKGEEEESRGRTRLKRLKGQMKENEDVILFTEPDDEDDTGRVIMVSSSLKDSGKGKGRALPADNARQKPKRFPMSTKMLQSINSSPTSLSPKWGKRSSESSGDERILKRSKGERDAFPQSPTRVFEEEGDSLLFSPDVDPRSLCPYCDTPLPENPSPLLRNLIVATKKKARPDPRPSNPLGLKAPVAVFVTVCQRHRFESQILPEAEKKGWPKTIQWNKLGNRILKMKAVLQSLIEDPGDSKDVGRTERVADDWEVVLSNNKRAEAQKPKRPKASCVFWNEVIQEIQEKGSRVVAGVRGQFANFEKAQPGYYGEQGSVIIHQTLYDMFPPRSMDAGLITPLTGNEFMEKILVPEVALRLIMEDRSLKGEEGKQEALTILRESATYGVFMFPEDSGTWGGGRRKANDRQLGVGDMIVMQRAMKRRRELEEEGRAEEEQGEKMQSEPEREAQRSADTKEAARTRPKPRPLGKRSSTMTMSSSQDGFPRSLWPEQNQSECEDTDPVGGIDTAEISESDSDGEWPGTRRDGRHSPSVGESIPRTRSRSIDCCMENGSWKMDEARPKVGLEDGTPKAPTPPLMRARRRHHNTNRDRRDAGTSRPSLPSRIHPNPFQNSRWLLDDESL